MRKKYYHILPENDAREFVKSKNPRLNNPLDGFSFYDDRVSNYFAALFDGISGKFSIRISKPVPINFPDGIGYFRLSFDHHLGYTDRKEHALVRSFCGNVLKVSGEKYVLSYGQTDCPEEVKGIEEALMITRPVPGIALRYIGSIGEKRSFPLILRAGNRFFVPSFSVGGLKSRGCNGIYESGFSDEIKRIRPTKPKILEDALPFIIDSWRALIGAGIHQDEADLRRMTTLRRSSGR